MISAYDLKGKKILILINVQKYPNGRDRKGSEIDGNNIITTFEERVQ